MLHQVSQILTNPVAFGCKATTSQLIRNRETVSYRLALSMKVNWVIDVELLTLSQPSSLHKVVVVRKIEGGGSIKYALIYENNKGRK